MHKHFCVDLDSGGTATTYMYDSRATAGALRGEARGVQARGFEEGSACDTVLGRRKREPPAQGADPTQPSFVQSWRVSRQVEYAGRTQHASAPDGNQPARIRFRLRSVFV